ncbi:MAG TPA: DNA replication and repair protein RecF [Gemmatimonadaceae bacterium]|nr:DNA replication and repair protein RecF [Gemmatimonadaceae bacterium]
MTASGDPGATGARVRLRRLAVRDFRNLARVELRPPAEGFAVVGENGHGKTNLLEAIYYLELLRSARGARDLDVVRFGEQGFHVSADVETEGVASHTIGVGFDRQARRKKVVVDGGEAARLSDAVGVVPSVLFSPRDAVLVSGAPAERRRFLDVVLGLTSRRYLVALQHYRAALARRNAALRDVARGRLGDERVAVWEPALAEHGAVLWTERAAWVERWAPSFAELCAAIGEHAPVELGHASQYSGGDVERARASLLDALEAKRVLDVKRGITHAGPHRDDLELLLGGRELRTFGSAGQQRTAALALRILEARTLRERVGASPLLLLDDPFAELDARRSARILSLLADGGLGQTVLAVPRAADIPPELTRLERLGIRDGVLEGPSAGSPPPPSSPGAPTAAAPAPRVEVAP